MEYDFALNINTSFYPDITMAVRGNDLTKLDFLSKSVKDLLGELSSSYQSVYCSEPFLDNQTGLITIMFDFQSTEYNIDILKRMIEIFQINKELRELISEVIIE